MLTGAVDRSDPKAIGGDYQFDRPIASEFINRHPRRLPWRSFRQVNNARAGLSIGRWHSVDGVSTGSSSGVQAGTRAWHGAIRRAGSSGLRVGLAPLPLARPMGSMAVG
jgi:hypothetical protein